mgnify:CR=1 FL=1
MFNQRRDGYVLFLHFYYNVNNFFNINYIYNENLIKYKVRFVSVLSLIVFLYLRADLLL